MESRRCRKVIAVLMATVIILGVSVPTVFAASENPTAKLYQRVAVWQENLKVVWQESLKEEVEYFRKVFQTKISEIPLLKNVVIRKHSDSDEIAFVVQKITIDEGRSPRTVSPKTEILKTKSYNSTAEKRNEDSTVKKLSEDSIAEKSSEKNNNIGGMADRPEISSRRNHNFMREDLELLARIIYAEARGESFEGQVAVGAVVLNRVESPLFPGTIREVIYQPGQFTAVKDRQIELQPNSVAYQAAQAALEGADPTNGALFYYNPKIASDQWIRTRSIVCSIGNHRFCV